MATANPPIDGKALLHVVLTARLLDDAGRDRLFARAPHLRDLLRRISSLCGQLAAGHTQPCNDAGLTDPRQRAAAARVLDYLLRIDWLARASLPPQRRTFHGTHAVGLTPTPN